MTDLEITRLCAEAMGIHTEPKLATDRLWAYKKWPDPDDNGGVYIYEPLNDDAQAMALVKKFNLQIATFTHSWVVIPCVAERIIEYPFDIPNDNLNRAICECVAKIQATKFDDDCPAD